MFGEFLLLLVNVLIIEPAQAELSARLGGLGAPAAVMQGVSSCVAAAHTTLGALYTENPWEGITTAFRLWTGLTSYEAVLQAEVPACEPALKAARPFIAREPG